MTKQKLWELIEAYRMSGGSEEHHARKEQLDAVLDGLLAQHDSGQAKPEPEQEPVAYPEGDVVGPCICGSWPGGKCLKCPRITTPPQRKPLTDEEIAKIASTPCAVVGSYVHTFARAIEAAHGIKE